MQKPRAARRRRFAPIAGALLCLAAVPAADGADPTTAPPAILAAPPAAPDSGSTWVFYLHGRIVQEQGRRAISDEHGPYHFDAILARLASAGFTVVSEPRPRDTDVETYADRIATQIRALVAAGVPPERITVVGASMGAWITMLVSRRLDLPAIGYVVMGTCSDDAERAFADGLHGDVLSIYEKGDPLGRSCGALLDLSAAIGKRAEIALDTGLGHGFLYRPLPEWVEPAIGWARGRAAGAAGAGRAGLPGVLYVSPADSPTALRDRLAADAGLVEVVLAAGSYRGGLTIPPLRDGAQAPAPLLIRPAAGARVVFEGGAPLPKLRRARAAPGVFWSAIEHPGGEPPAIFDPDARVRYTYAADAAAVARFPGTVAIEGGRLLVHPPDGRRPKPGSLLRSVADQGLAIERAGVTVVGIEFRNFVARAKWSSGVQATADDTTLLRCRTENASIGFSMFGARAAVFGAAAQDVGCGVYLAGEEGRAERCRLAKRRDDYEVPTYAQDDAGVQFYYPARGGRVVGNLVVGFGTGVLIKAERAPYRTEGNTLVGAGGGVGFLATDWHPDETLRANVIEGFAIPAQWPANAERRNVAANCYAPSASTPKGFGEPGSIVAVPRFADPAAGDFRLDPGSDCLKAASEEAGIGAPAAVLAAAKETASRAGWPRGSESIAAAASRSAEARPAPSHASAAAAPGIAAQSPPRTWHVSLEGRDGSGGDERAPLRRLQEAVDRAGPGDTILVGPGLYADPVRFARGGEAERPITLRAATPGTVILDGQRRHDVVIDLDGAPFVVLRDLEIRWFRLAGIRVRKSPDVVITGCRIWNAHWGGTWPTGNGIEADRSPRLRVEGNTLFAQERGLFLYFSPQAVVRHNTAVGNLYGGAQFIFSLQGSVCRDNSFAFQGNDAMAIVETPEGRDRLAGADIDHNNYGMTLRGQPPGTVADRIAPRPIDRHLAVPSKALIYYEEQPGTWRRFESLAAWREFSGKDAHSIVADPLFVKTAARDFRFEAASPNRGAGTDGGNIGAAE